MNETAHIALVRALLGLNHAEAAYKLGERLRQDAESAGRGGRLIEILALQALALKALGDQLQALAVLRQALTLAEPQGYIRVFVDEGEPLALLIHELRSEIENQRRSSSEEKQRRLLKYIQKLLTAFRSGPVGKPTLHRVAQTASRPQVGPATLPRPFPGCPQPPSLRLSSTAQSPYPNLHPPFSNPLEPLSERETEILRLIASGLSNQEVARRLVLAPSTIHWHMKNIYSKLDVHSRTQAVARAVELGIFL
jgi:LuxR family maltose regulon positive regulatory protein